MFIPYKTSEQVKTCEYSQDETSELFIGEWMEKRGIRDQLVIATKVCLRRSLRSETPLNLTPALVLVFG